VVVGLSPPHFHYDILTTAFRILKREAPYASSESPPLIATHKAKYISNSSNQLSLGPGPFVTALESAAGVQATVVGKPTRTFFELVISSLGLPEDLEMTGKIVVVGDDVETDLGGGAVELGLWRVLGSFDPSKCSEPQMTDHYRFLLVKTGKYRPGDESKTDHPPDEVVDSFATFVDRLISTHI
jgi:ribonucleotide monophosphatase NagD (HAD superfamily)